MAGEKSQGRGLGWAVVQRFSDLCQIEAIEVYHLVPGGNEITHAYK